MEMRILVVCIYIVAATAAAAVIPVNNLRQRRDVSEVASKYLPPAREPVTEYLPPAEVSVTESLDESEIPQDSVIFGKNGYEYKTVRRIRYRHRRDASEVVPEYLPPAEESASEIVATTEVPEDSAVLSKNGYEYKTVRRLKYRHRRDISEVATEYLPPAEDSVTEAIDETLQEDPKIPQEFAILGKNGYEYKTVRRLKYRKRRDVSEIATKYLPSNKKAVDDVSEIAPDYLAPAEEPVTEILTEEPETPQHSAVLSENGYEYKTVRRLKYKKRRDVSEISTKYLPSYQESVDDVLEIAHDYLPPTEEPVTEVVDGSEVVPDSAVLGKDGYEYKTVRRLKYRKRRDVSEIVGEYLPPTITTDTPAIQSEVDSSANGAGALLEDGYHYDVPKKEFSIMRIEDAVSPPEEDDSIVVEAPSAPPPASAILAKDGYHYRIVKRLRH